MSLKDIPTITKYEHTPQILQRRRSLFPSMEEHASDDNSSDLGHMSPISFDSVSDIEDAQVSYQNYKQDSIGDYDILGIVDIEVKDKGTPKTSNNGTYADLEEMSPLYLSPFVNKLDVLKRDSIPPDTPLKSSPIKNLKTPHDTSSTNMKVPKLVRKSLMDPSTTDHTSNKRKLSPTSSPPINKQLKLERDSKVRTALFPDVDISLSVKSFYPKQQEINKNDNAVVFTNDNKKKNIDRLKPSYPTMGGRRIGKRYGQINAGVKHMIKKPKKKKIDKTALLNAAKTILNMDMGCLNEYINDVKLLKHDKNISLIENKENISKSLENNTTRKRIRSPSPEPDNSKKFFKFSKNKGVVTVNKNIKLNVNNGKFNLIEKPNKYAKNRGGKLIFDTSDLETNDENLIPNSDIDNILSCLDNVNESNENTITLQAHNSVTQSDNSILLHKVPNHVANILLSPTSQMCDMASGLALNSPKKANKNLNNVLNSLPSPNNVFNKVSSAIDMEQQKLFPIFNAAANKEKRNIDVTVTKNINQKQMKKFKKCSENQMLLDAGQKKFGVTQCTECNFIYHMGDPSDEIMHSNYHEAGHIFRFTGWKNERVVSKIGDDRIIQVVPTDSKAWIKKVKDLMEVVNRDLGYYDMEEFNIDNAQVFLYIKNKTIVGCIVAVIQTEAHKILTSTLSEVDMCSEETFAVKCGISRIWVSSNFRNQGIGSTLMNSVKMNFMYGCPLSNDDIAISAPGEIGKKFAKSYFKTNNFLIYY